LGDSMPQGTWYVRVAAVDANGIHGVPSNVVTFTLSFNAPLPPPPTLLTPANGATTTLPITFKWTDVPNPQPLGYTIEIAKDSAFSNIEFLYNQITGPAATITSLTSGTKYWRVLSTQGDSAPDTAAVTAWSATGTFVIPNTPPKVVSLAVAIDPASNGDDQTVTLQLTTAAPSGGAVINLTSSNPSAAPLPATFTMPAGFAWNQFRFTIGSVSVPTLVTVTATINSTSASSTFTVDPVTLKSLSVFSPMTGGVATSLIVMLNGAAPSGGAVVNLSSDSSAASPPSTVTVAAGDQSVTVNVPTSPVSSNTTVTLSASLNGTTVQTKLTLTPQQAPASLTLSPNPTIGSNGSFATVTVATAPSSDLTLPVTCSNPSVATCDHAVVIPAGATTGGINIFTVPVTTQQLVTVSVSGAGVTKSAVLTVQPASTGATPTPTPVPATATPTRTATPTLVATATSTSVAPTTTPTSLPQTPTPTPSTSASATLSSLILNPTSVSGGNSSTGTVKLSAPAPSGGVVVVLSSNNTSVATLPSSVTIQAGATSATFTINTTRPSSDTTVTISATYNGVTKTATLTVTRR
jgi:hypothetical protein